MNAVIYDTTTGAILRAVSGPADHIPLQCQEGESYAEDDTARDNTHYFDLDSETVQPKSDYALDALPLPCTVTIEGVEYTCTEQPTFEFNYPGTYLIKVDAGVAYLEKEFSFDYQP